MSASIATTSSPSTWATPAAAPLARPCALAQFLKARLLVVSVTPRYEGNMHRWKIANADARLNEPFVTCLEEMRQIAAEAGQPVEPAPRRGQPGGGDRPPGRRAAGRPGGARLPEAVHDRAGLLGRTAARVIGYSPCDVLMIPEQSAVQFNRIRRHRRLAL